MLDGYELLKAPEGEDEHVDACAVYVAHDVTAFLDRESKNDRANVRQIGRILHRMRQYGPSSIKNTEQFRHEAKLSTKSRSGEKVAVYAVKAHQLRVYGGTVRVKGETVFVCVESARKKTDKADQTQLKRVAEILGKLGDGS